MTEDPELADALARAERYLGPGPKAGIVRELVLRGADQLEQERSKALEGLIRLSLRQDDLLDWDVLERIEEIQAELEDLPPPVE